MTSKRPRTVRQRGTHVALQPRDLDLLTLVGLTRGATTSQIARALFPNEDRARRRIRALFDGGFVDVSLTSSTAPSLLTLTRYGKAELIGFRPLLVGRVAVARPPAPHAVRHHVLVVELRLWLVGLARQQLIHDLVVEAPPVDLMPWKRHRLVPDAVAAVSIGTDSCFVALEADRGTEAAIVLEEKLTRYVRALADSVADGLVIAVEGPDIGRVVAIARRAGLGRGVAVVTTTGLAAGDAEPLALALQRPLEAL